MKKSTSLLLVIVVSLSMLSVLTLGYGWISGDVLEVSDANPPNIMEWTRTRSADIDGYPAPYSDWEPVVSAWRHPTWKRVDNIKNIFYDAEADWIWRVNKVSGEEAKTGSVVFFQKKIVLPPDTVITSDWSFKITADNAFYLYISQDGPRWSGTPLLQDGFTDWIDDDNPPAFIDEFGYPKEGSIITDSSIVRTVASLPSELLVEHLKPGDNWLTIVAVNAQPSPSDKQTSSNTAGLIFKLQGAWDLPLVLPPGFIIPLDSAPPETIDPILVMDPMTLYPIQAVYDSDYNGDTITDIVLGKPMAVQVRVEDGSGVLGVRVTYEGELLEDLSPVDNVS